MRSCCTAQGQNMMENNIKRRYIYRLYIYDWITFLYSRNWHNIVNQLYFNKKKRRCRVSFFPIAKQPLNSGDLAQGMLLWEPHYRFNPTINWRVVCQLRPLTVFQSKCSVSVHWAELNVYYYPAGQSAKKNVDSKYKYPYHYAQCGKGYPKWTSSLFHSKQRTKM